MTFFRPAIIIIIIIIISGGQSPLFLCFFFLTVNRPVSYSQLPLITLTIDSFLQYEPRLDVKYS